MTEKIKNFLIFLFYIIFGFFYLEWFGREFGFSVSVFLFPAPYSIYNLLAPVCAALLTLPIIRHWKTPAPYGFLISFVIFLIVSSVFPFISMPHRSINHKGFNACAAMAGGGGQIVGTASRSYSDFVKANGKPDLIIADEYDYNDKETEQFCSLTVENDRIIGASVGVFMN